MPRIKIISRSLFIKTVTIRIAPHLIFLCRPILDQLIRPLLAIRARNAPCDLAVDLNIRA